MQQVGRTLYLQPGNLQIAIISPVCWRYSMVWAVNQFQLIANTMVWAVRTITNSHGLVRVWAWGRNNVKWRLAVNFGWRTYVCMFVWSQKLTGINESWRYSMA